MIDIVPAQKIGGAVAGLFHAPGGTFETEAIDRLDADL